MSTENTVNPYRAVVCLAKLTSHTGARGDVGESKQIQQQKDKMLIKWGGMCFLQQNELCVCL